MAVKEKLLNERQAVVIHSECFVLAHKINSMQNIEKHGTSWLK